MNPFDETILDHLNIGVSDAARSKAFYEAALAPLGLKLLHTFSPQQAEEGGEQQKTQGTIHGFGRQYKPLFWIVGNARVGEATHFAFKARTRAEVDAFHTAALAAGGTDNGAPGLRRYHENYYAAFVHDPDGINIEAVCNSPE
ncbi:VOC family protein [Sphingomonas qomolangmaensis]|uniref:VOC family protein n=1 Tax=Sphingomonas qomolangmaensis TaxID=2918765 RepID=A0ABY5LDN2_9SPHN|nr:VOC family protein [Sphingomonas qomolangmaensis]UUL83793.1 VOC family protein [Sphingomonas qomolangmaensis]